MSTVIGLDPGTERSAIAEVCRLGNPSTPWRLSAFGIYDNRVLLGRLYDDGREAMLVIEMMRCYGAIVGDSTFETCV